MATHRERRESYLHNKLNTCNALMAEKEATIKRLELELKGLKFRRERIGKSWLQAKRELEDERDRNKP